MDIGQAREQVVAGLFGGFEIAAWTISTAALPP
jgi:hypothetical protein